MSGRPGNPCTFLRNRYPPRCNADRTRRSGSVPMLRIARIIRRRPSGTSANNICTPFVGFLPWAHAARPSPSIAALRAPPSPAGAIWYRISHRGCPTFRMQANSFHARPSRSKCAPRRLAAIAGMKLLSALAVAEAQRECGSVGNVFGSGGTLAFRRFAHVGSIVDRSEQSKNTFGH